MITAFGFWLSVVAGWSQTPADAPADPSVAPPSQPEPSRSAKKGTAFRLQGFVKPVFSALVRTASLPADQLDIGLTGSRAGIIMDGRPFPAWKYRVFFVVGGSTFAALTQARAVDSDNDGVVDQVATTARNALGDMVRETSLAWAPSKSFQIRAGQMPVPFTSAAQSSDVALLFSERAGPNQLFLAEDDLGALAELRLGQGIFLAKGGLFNGTGTGPSGGQRGVLYLARVDVQPLGDFAFDETNPARTAPRIGLGASVIWHPYNEFDGVGYPRIQVSDLRLSGSIRAGVGGFTIAVEGLHRHQVDNLTNRPVIASGAYAQVGWRLPFGLEPIGRIGWAAEDRSFDPRVTVWTEGGFNVYPVIQNINPSKRNDLRLTLAYQGEHRLTEGESAHAAVATAIVRFR